MISFNQVNIYKDLQGDFWGELQRYLRTWNIVLYLNGKLYDVVF